MDKDMIYLDNSATTPLSEDMKKYIVKILDYFGNPSSIHSTGIVAKKIINDSRKIIADFINADKNEIFFTSGGSASNTLAIRGYYRKHNCCVLYSPIAHKSILKCVKDYKYSYPLKVDSYGLINLSDLKEWLDCRDINPFVVIDYANSEIGTIQNIKEIIDLVHFYNGVVYLDCTGSIPTIPLNVKALNVDMAGFSSHKLGGLKGCGVLYKKPKIELEPIIYGNQESGLIGGTENVLGIASLGNAVKYYNYYSSAVSHNRNYVYDYIVNNISDCYLVGTPIGKNRLSNNLYMCFKDIEGESLMILLDMNGIQVSTGSACNSNDIEVSNTLFAIGMDKNDIYSCIRLTFSGRETKEELLYVCKKIKKCVEELRNLRK